MGLRSLARSVYFGAGLPALRRLPVSSRVFGPAKGLHEAGERQAGRVRELRPAGEVIRRRPAAAVPWVPNEMASPATYLSPAIYTAELSWGRVATSSFDILSAEDRVFGEFLLRSQGRRPSPRSTEVPCLPRMQKRMGCYATFCLERAGNHYHWFIDCLTRLWALELSGERDYRLMVPAEPSALQLQTLERLGYPEERLARFAPEHWCVERLLVPSLASLESEVSPGACRWLRYRLLDAGKLRGGARRRLLVSRQRAGKRRLIGEDELFERLAKRGFERVIAERMSIGEQIELFGEAEIMVGAHGAGLTNMLFMPEGGRVVELIRHDRVKTMFFSLANALGHRYGCVTDAPEDPAAASPCGGKDIDFAVPAERVERALEMLGA